MKKIILTSALLTASFATAHNGETHTEETPQMTMPMKIEMPAMDHSMHMKMAQPKTEAVPMLMNEKIKTNHLDVEHSVLMKTNQSFEMAIPNVDHSMHSNMENSINMEEKKDVDHATMNHSMHIKMDKKKEIDHSMHTDMDHSMKFFGKKTTSSQAYFEANMDMHTGMAIEFTNDPDLDFLRGMIPHHQGAIDMAQIQLEHGKDGSLKHVTGRIIRDQVREIAWMKQILANEVKKEEKTNIFATAEYKAQNKSMHAEMNIEFTGNADIDFVNGMIPHHEGAVEMAQTVIKYGNNPAAKRIAYDIISAQKSEIYWMKQWRKRVNKR